MSFSKQDDANLCVLISGNPILYDPSRFDYRDIIEKNNIWKKIAISLGGGKTDENCKKRWHAIRTHYRRLKKREGKLGTGSAAKKSLNWPLMNNLSFLSDIPERKSTRTNIPDQYEDLSHDTLSEDLSQTPNENDSVTSPSVPPSSASDTTSRQSKKRKYDKDPDILFENREARSKFLEALNENSQRQDEVDIFYKSIAMSVKRLPPILIAEAKMKHLQTLNDLHLKHMYILQQ